MNRKIEYTFPQGALRDDKLLGPYQAWDYGPLVVVKMGDPANLRTTHYSITAKSSGLALLGHVNKQRVARLWAAVAAALPMDWNNPPATFDALPAIAQKLFRGWERAQYD